MNSSTNNSLDGTTGVGIASAKSKGYKFLIGGESGQRPGYFIPITIIDNQPADARIAHEEQFDPVLPQLKFDDVEEAQARANASDCGLAGSVWSADPEKACAIGERLENGTVWIDEVQYMTPLASFGGHRQSDIKVENGIDGLLEYTAPQTIVLKKSVAAPLS